MAKRNTSLTLTASAIPPPWAAPTQVPREPTTLPTVSLATPTSIPAWARSDPEAFLAAQKQREDVTTGFRPRVADKYSAATDAKSLTADTSATSGGGAIRRTTEKLGRRAKAGNAHAVSTFRPQVPAKDRMRCWTTPWIRDMEGAATKNFGGALLSQAFEAALGGCVEKTDACYGSGLLRWAQFGDKHEISENDRMPAPAILIAAFAAECRGEVSGKTVGGWISAVRRQHILARAPWYGDDEWVKLARRTANREGSKHHRPPRPPVTTTHLRALRAGLDLDAPHDAAVWAGATAAFWGCRRLGEVTVSTEGGLDPQFHVLRAEPVRYATTSDGVESATFHIPWTKTTREKGAQVVMTGRSDDLCPVAAMRNHMRVNAGAPPDAHLFAHRKTSGGFGPLVKTRMIERCDEICTAAGLAAIFGHGFRIGGASELLLAGVDPTVIASLGGWTSLAFLLYWRKIEEILPKSIAGAYSSSRIRAVVSSMDAFRVRSGIPKNVEDIQFEM